MLKDPADFSFHYTHTIFKRFMHTFMHDFCSQNIQKLDLYKTQLQAIITLFHIGPCTMSRLGDALNLEKGSTTALIDSLVAKELVERVRDTEDRRRVLTGLTEAGRNTAITAMEEINIHFKNKTALLQEPEITSLKKAFIEIDTILSKLENT